MLPHKKAYRAPQADENTFASQQEFLDSLVPILLDLVDEGSRKCAHCWRPYGEANPGEDDAEAPVRFKCNHIFGEQCMRSLFAVREPVRLDLKPLSFAPGSNGAELGSRLKAYVDSHGVERSTFLTGGNREKTFAQLLHEVMPTVQTLSLPTIVGPGFDILGRKWMVLVHQIFNHSDKLVDKIELMENAIIVNSDSSEHQIYPFFPNNIYLTPSLSGPSSYIVDFPSVPLPQVTSQANQITPPHLTWTQEEQKIKEKQDTVSLPSPTWKDALSSKSKLDILVQTHKDLKQQGKQSDEQIPSPKAEQEDFYSYGSHVIAPSATHIPPSPFADMRAAARTQHNAELHKRTEMFIKRLAQSFAQVHEAFERYQYNEAMAVGIPPPTKKMRLADPKKISSASVKIEVDADYYQSVRQSVFVLNTIAHRHGLDETGLEVMPPYSYESTASEETETDEDDVEDDGYVDAERAPTVVAGKVILVKRKTCRHCCLGPESFVQSLNTPEYVFWPDNKKIPDNCPKCRRILFIKDD